MSSEGRAERVALPITDVDGVLTDGRIFLADDGTEMKGFHVRDGAGVVYARRAGIPVALITGRSSALVARRAMELGITDVFQGAIDKRPPFLELLRRHDLAPEQVAYVGDDLLDLPLLTRVGFAVTVADAVPEVREVAHHVTDAPGGGGALREVVEVILRAQGRWDAVVARYRDVT
jgi:3-deoxy-D-manno-octulosonate 8-phosphate phosphatase (KDO 8-P phosphatase)